jgi:hypothetical protein
MMIQIVPATEAHARAMAPHLRAADADEVLALGFAPDDALVESVRASFEAWTALVDGRPMCMWGLTAPMIMDVVGVPWLLTTPEIERHRRAFLVGSRRMVAEMLAVFPRLENWVDPRHTKAVRWLRWLGFTVEAPAPYGPLGAMFCRVTMGV